jgi:molybdopterin synthase catalytic subunit
MRIEIAIIPHPIDRHRELPKELASLAGAVVEFAGIVRGEENGRPIAALDYEAYSPMAESVMRRIIEQLNELHECLLVRVIHRIGIVPVGEAAVHIMVAAVHRAEAFAMLTAFMNRLKEDAPIWKRRVIFV